MSVNLPAIDRLLLDEAFSDNVYRPFSECWTVRMDSELLLVDDDVEKVSRFSDNEEERSKALVIINEKNRQIVLLSIDNKLIKDHEGGIADCALFDDNQFHFVEFKTNAYGNSEQSIRDTFEKAISQLVETIRVFQNRLIPLGIDINEVISLSCQIVVSESFPRSSALKQEYQIRFADENDGIGLSINRKLFWERSLN